MSIVKCTTEVGIKSPGQALTLLSEDGLRFVCRTLSEPVLASRTFGADLRICNSTTLVHQKHMLQPDERFRP